MRTFQDEKGRSWVAEVGHRPGPDYQGRFYMVIRPDEGTEEESMPLPEIRWNSEGTARRTLETMSEVELRRRLRIARRRVAAEA